MITIELANNTELTITQKKEIVKMIYNTDKYIYPYLCSNYQEFEELFLYQLEQNGFYSINNIIIAKDNNKLAGMLLVFNYNCKSILLPNSFPLETQINWENTEKNLLEPISSILKNNDTVYINNISVLPEHRKKGIATKLIAFLKKNTKKNIVLDCLEENINALSLYKHEGFKIVDQYYGFSNNEIKPKCFKMIYINNND